MCIKPLSTFVDSNCFICHSFFYDIPLQMFAHSDNIFMLLPSMQSCAIDVKAWEIANMLRLNDNKTELVLFI